MEPEIITKRMVGECSSSVTDSRLYGYQLFCKKTTFTECMRFLKKKGNFTRSCAFAQKVKFYALQMLKNKISRILKLLTWQHCGKSMTTAKQQSARLLPHWRQSIII